MIFVQIGVIRSKRMGKTVRHVQTLPSRNACVPLYTVSEIVPQWWILYTMFTCLRGWPGEKENK